LAFAYNIFFFGDNNIESSLQTSLTSLGNGQQVNSLAVAAFAGQKKKESKRKEAAAATATQQQQQTICISNAHFFVN